MAEAPPISFDDAGRIKILDKDTFRHTEQLEKESREFVQRIREFNQTVHEVLTNLNVEAEIVEAAKLKAIGQRNLVQAEAETRRRRQRELQALIDERNAELARITAECDSLVKMDAYQRDVIEKLSNNERAGF